MTSLSLRGLITLPARRPVATLIVAALFAVLSVLGIRRLTPNASLEKMFARNDPAATALARVLNGFSAVEDLLVFVSLPSGKNSDKSEVNHLLSYAQRLETAIANSPDANTISDGLVYRVDDQTRAFFEKVLVPSGLFYLDDSAFEAARHRLTRPEMAKQIQRNEAMISAPGPAAEALAKVFLQDPLHLHDFILDRLLASRPFRTYKNSDAFISEDGTSLLIRIIGKHPPSDLEFSKRMISVLTPLIHQANTEHLDVEISGAYAIAAASERSIRHDMIESVISSVVCLILLFVIVYRRPFQLFSLGFIPIVVGILFGFGGYSLYSIELSPLSAVIGGILAGMGIDYSIQYLSYYHVRRSLGRSSADSASDTVLNIGAPLLAALATSVAGFFAIGMSSVSALRDFAILGSLGLCGAFLGSVVILPALVVLIDRRHRGSPSTVPISRFSMGLFLRPIARRPMVFIAISLLITAASLAIIFSPGEILQFESDLSVMHPRPNPPLDAQMRIAQKMGGDVGSFLIHLRAQSSDQLLSLAHRVNTRLQAPAIRTLGVKGTWGLASLLPDPAVVQTRLGAIKPGEVERVLTDFRAVIADSIFESKAYEPYAEFLRILLARTSAPNIADLLPYRRLAEGFLPSSAIKRGLLPTEAITLIFIDKPVQNSAARNEIISTIRAALTDLPDATLTGMSVVSHDVEITIHHDLPRLLGVCIVLVVTYLVIQFRSLKDSLLSILPAVFSMICLLALSRLTNQKLNMVNLISLPLLIGIDVDYGIFLVSLARVAQRGDKNDWERHVFASCQAIFLCGAATILGFGSLAFTSVPAIRSLGWAVGVGVISCLAGTLFLLFPVLARSKKTQEQQS